jgi:glycosyltransferase involved in cell wall biosynthesis
MNILVVTGIFPPDAGGPATYVPLMTAALVEKGHSVELITLSDGPEDDSARSYPVLRIPRKLPKPWRVLKTIFTIGRASVRADVVFVNGLQFESAVAMLFSKKRFVEKVVGDLAWEQGTNRGWVKDPFDEFQRRRYPLKVRGLQWVRNWPLKRAAAVIANSHYMALQIAGWGIDPQKISVVHNSASLPDGTRSIEPLEGRSPVVVSVGRFVPWKGFAELIEAVENLEGAGLVIVGDGPEKEMFERRAKEKGTDDRILFAGRRPHDETLGLMAGADVFVLNSEWESFPHVVLEAMYLGLPVIGTATGGTAEIIDHEVTGLLIEPGKRELGSALGRLAADPQERARLAAAGAKKVRAEFSHDQMVERTERVLIDASR